MNLVPSRGTSPRNVSPRRPTVVGDPALSIKGQHKSMQDQVRREVFAFAEYDLDGNERLDFEEFFAMLPRYIREHHTVDAIRVWFEAADSDKDGELSINEFFKWSLSNASQRYGAQSLNLTFREYDDNNSGQLK